MKSRNEEIQRALLDIQSQCDGAHRLDGVGFNKLDAPRAEDLLCIDWSKWDASEINFARYLLRKYHRQAEELGYDVQTILDPPLLKVVPRRSSPCTPSTTATSAKSGESTATPSQTKASPSTSTSSAVGATRPLHTVSPRSRSNGSGQHPNGSTPPSARVNMRPPVRSGALVNILPTPGEIGLPPKFDAWRAKQDEAILRAYDSPKRFVALALPTGAGKSAVYVALAKVMAKRAAILTSTKALQAQLADDFTSTGLVDIRGVNNYDCLESHSNPDKKVRSCDHGYCHSGRRCELMKSGCLYYDAISNAKGSELVSTNYAYWLAKQAEQDRREEGKGGLGKFELLVLDEAHDAVDELCSFLGARIPRADVRMYCQTDFPESTDLEAWRAWAGVNAEMLAGKIETLKAEIRMGVLAWYKEMWKVRAMEKLMQENSKVAGMQGQWLMEVTRQGSSGEMVAVFDPVWPGPYAEATLFRGIPKIVFTSATVTRKTVELLGVPESEIEFAEYPSTFPKERRPIISVPGVRVDNRADQQLLKLWVSKIDAIIDKRLDRKGIVHTVSYARAEFIAKHSRHRDIMLLHETRTARHVVEVFKDSPAPLVLVSPSMTTGWDFPYDACRYQIIGKVPFPDTRNRIVAERTKQDPTYGMYLAMQQLVQSSGRGMRAADDICETIIVDDHFKWFIGKNKRFAPKWFMDAVVFSNISPQPLPL